MNLSCTPSVSSSFLRECRPCLWSKISEAIAAFLSPITCRKDMQIVINKVKPKKCDSCLCRGQSGEDKVLTYFASGVLSLLVINFRIISMCNQMVTSEIRE